MDKLQHSSVFISTQSTAMLTGKTVRTVHNWLESGVIQGKKMSANHLPGGMLRQIDLSSVESHICIALTPELIDCIQQADRGEATALKLVGIAFSAEQQHTIAVPWLEAAAKKGEVDAMDLLYWHYLNGEGVPKDASLALQWLAKAAEQGLPTAKIKLRHLGFEVGPIQLKDGSVYTN